MKNVFLLIFATWICCNSTPSNALPAIKIGVLSGLTGAAAKRSGFQNMGITLAVEELRAAGTDISLVIEDSATNGAKALTAFNKLYSTDGVNAVISDDFSFAVAPVVSAAKKQQRFFLTTSKPQDDDCLPPIGGFYSLAANHEASGVAVENFFTKHPEIRRIALFTFDDPAWGHVYKRIWHTAAQAKGVEVVYSYETDNLFPDFRTPLTQALGKKPDALLFAHEPNSFLRTAAQLGFKGMIIAANNVLEVLADTAVPPAELEGVYVVDPVIDSSFREKFVGRFHKPPLLEAYVGYDALHVVVKAIREGNGVPERGIKNLYFKGAGGDVHFSPESCSGSGAAWHIVRYSSGEFLPLEQ